MKIELGKKCPQQDRGQTMGDIIFGICVVLAGLFLLAVTVWTVGA